MAIKTAAASGADYTAATIQSGWINTYLAGKSGSFTEDEILELANETFNITAGIDASAIDPGAFKVIIRPASGAGMSSSNPLRYGQSGAKIKDDTYGHVMFKMCANMELRGFQVERTNGNDHDVFVGAAGTWLDGLVISHTGNRRITSGVAKVTNCAAYSSSASDNIPFDSNYLRPLELRNNTFLFPARTTAIVRSATQAVTAYNNLLINNGSTSPFNAVDGGSFTASHNATNAATITGSSSLTSQTPDSLLVTPTLGASLDLKAETTGNLKNAGTSAQATAADIFGTARDSTPYIGAHEADVDGGDPEPTATANLTGVEAAAAAGTLGKALSRPLTGQVGAAAAGTLAKTIAKTLTGVGGTGAAGTLAPAIAVNTANLTGIAGAGAAGAVIAVQAGTNVTLSGAAGTGAAGTLAATAASGEITLQGVFGTGQAGAIRLTGDIGGVTTAVPPAGGGSDSRRGARRRRVPYVLPDGRRIRLYPEEIADLVARGRLPATQRPVRPRPSVAAPSPASEPAPIVLPRVRDRSADIERLMAEARTAGRLADMVAGMAEGLSAAMAAERAAEDQRRRRRRRAAALLLLQ